MKSHHQSRLLASSLIVLGVIAPYINLSTSLRNYLVLVAFLLVLIPSRWGDYQVDETVEELRQRSIAVIRTAMTFGFVVLAAFFVVSSRPTADEYLLAPVIDGYYVDQPKLPLFKDANSRFVDYFKGARAIVHLGWDAWPNALTFQMGSGTLVNYVGPLGTVLQGMVYVLVWVACLRLLARKLSSHRSRWYELQSTAMIALGVVGSMSVANFNTTRVPFGLYPFLGIRFGLYVVHALILVALVVQTLSVERQESNQCARTRSLYLWTAAFVGFVSLWYVVYLVVFLTLRGLTRLVRKQSATQYAAQLTVSVASAFVFYEGLGGVKGRTAARSTGISGIVRNFVHDVVLNSSSRLYSQELWSTVIGWHSVVAAMIGFVTVLSIPDRESTDCDYARPLVRISLCGIALLPLLFVFQEYVTYEAWWHRSTPIVLSSISFIILGARVANFATPKLSFQRQGLFIGLVTTALVSLCILPLANSVSSINRFRASWDAGNILGLGSPVENNADYNVINAFRVSPYRHTNWDVQTRMLASIPLSISPTQENLVSDSADSPVSCFTDVELKSSPFDTELGGEVDYRIVLSDALEQASMQVIGVVDDLGTRWENLKTNLSLVGRVSVPGKIRVMFFGLDCNGAVPIAQIALRFTSQIQNSKSLRIDEYVLRGLG